jgi:type II secretory ATPase GspE/PulE/Tfp pilus assembly ATPase PilB-like protein
VVPLAAAGRELEVGVDGSIDSVLLRRLALVTGMKIRPTPVPTGELEARLRALYPDAPPGLPSVAVDHMGSVVEPVQACVREARERGASDIHFEPSDAGMRVRFRLDGLLRVEREWPAGIQEEVISRIKILAGLDIAERRRPQDGRFQFSEAGAEVDVRVSTLPTGGGEKAVLRLLDRRRLPLDLPALGLESADLEAVHEALRVPHGLILATGPTGSGKTTTLYAALASLNTPEVNIVTVEDPVEYALPGINQTHVRADIGYTFSQALRAFLRQDPNVILVGEIRDAETAELAVRAALTGHRVLSTVHTNDAVSTVGRLLDLGVAPFLLASSLRLVIAQRLLRRPCVQCVGGDADCPTCRGSGYRGRIAVFEILRVTGALADLIALRADPARLLRQARADGLRPLREAAYQCLKAGLTTEAEVLRETAA